MVIYSMALGISVTDVFLGGVIPGIMLACGMALYSIIYGIKHKGEIKIHKFSLRNLWLTFKDAIWALLMPVIILGGIYGGIFTPTESAAVAILYGLIVSKFIYHELDFAVLKDIMSGAIKTTCQIMFIVCSATAFAYVLTRENVTANMAKALIGAANSTVMFWLLVTILLLIVGCIMDTVPAIMILAPLFAACLKTYGISDVAFGVIMVINLGIGLCTPPVGSALFVGCAIGKTPIERTSKNMLPLYAVMVTVLLLVTYIPEISLWLPRLTGYAG